jgi:hypothetical protein
MFHVMLWGSAMSRFSFASLLTTACTALLAAPFPAAAVDSTHGAIQGSTVSPGGASLNGMCGVLYDRTGQQELMQLASTGTDGTSGQYVQDNILPGTYKLLFVNCGADTDGQGPDYHYTPIFLGNTWNVKLATKVVVRRNAVTALGLQPVPYGGVVQGVVTDSTTRSGADTPVVAFVPPDGSAFFLGFSWTLLCADSTGHYNSTSGFQQGVPDGAKVIFAPDNWGCQDSQGNFNAGKFFPSRKNLSIIDGGTITVNGRIAETGEDVVLPKGAPHGSSSQPQRVH